MRSSIRKRPSFIDEAVHDTEHRCKFEALVLAETKIMYVALCKLADAMGISVRQMNEMGMWPGHSPPETFINPLDITQQWHGIGRKPKWLIDWENSGKSLNHVIW